MHCAYEHGIWDWRDSPRLAGRDLRYFTVYLFWLQRAGKLCSLPFLDIDLDAFGMNPSPHPYSFTTIESFQATRSKPKLIKLITSFLQSTHFCPFLYWFQCLSDPALSQFQCAQMVDMYPGGKRRNKGIKKKEKVMANNFLLSLQTAQHRNR